jgi:ABC-2 type transport system permease protein
MHSTFSWQRTCSMARKEMLHILRDPTTLFMTLFFPLVELIMLGYAIDTNVRDLRMAVLDQCRTQESERFVQSLQHSKTFLRVRKVQSDEELFQALKSGDVRVGLKIPENYSRRRERGEPGQILMLVDGTQNNMAAEAVNVVNAIALRESLVEVLDGNTMLPVESRPRVLYNPDTRTANFFIPGMLVVLCQMMAITLSANAIVREKEKGTLEQLFMTPVRPMELILGKMIPYLVLTFLEFCGIALFMRYLFQVPIHGHFVTLLGLALPFVLTCLAWGLWVSTKVSTRDAAMQMSMATVLPCIFLSGYIFPLDSMPRIFYYPAQLIPTTWLIDAARGVILRSAGWAELWVHAAVLWSMAIAFMLLGTLQFRKRL